MALRKCAKVGFNYRNCCGVGLDAVGEILKSMTETLDGSNKSEHLQEMIKQKKCERRGCLVNRNGKPSSWCGLLPNQSDFRDKSN